MMTARRARACRSHRRVFAKTCHHFNFMLSRCHLLPHIIYTRIAFTITTRTRVLEVNELYTEQILYIHKYRRFDLNSPSFESTSN